MLRWAVVLLLSPMMAAAQPPSSIGPAPRAVPTRVKEGLRRLVFDEEPSYSRLTVPIIDVDPNRGVTVGVAPTWFLVSSGTTRSIHAPAAAYNTIVGASVAYDYYVYPSSRTQFEAYGTTSQNSDREVLVEYTSTATGDHPKGGLAHVQMLRDSARRFYGIGPRSTQDRGTSYTLDSHNYNFVWSRRVLEDFPLLASFGQHTEVIRILSSPDKLPDVQVNFPEGLQLRSAHTDAAARFSLALDTRDEPLAPHRGVDAEMFMEGARRGWISDFTYARYGGELRAFHPLDEGADPGFILAFDSRVENLDGNVPFYLLPTLGGKRSLRAYGDGRFADGFMASARAELRRRVAEEKISGAPVAFWVDPFAGVGAVAPDLFHIVPETIRPGYGLALRAVSEPQVVVSADFGVGQEGLKVFLDMTYAF